MRVIEVAEDGLELAFLNKSNAHLWRSVQFGNREMDIKTDFFRLFQAAAVMRDDGALLLTQQNGRWLFPGHFLATQQDWQQELTGFLRDTLAVEKCKFRETLLVDSQPEIADGATATVFMLHRVWTEQRNVELAADTPYKKTSWFTSARDVEELSFSDEKLRTAALELLARKVSATTRAINPESDDLLDPIMQTTEETIKSLQQPKEPHPVAALRKHSRKKSRATRPT